MTTPVRLTAVLTHPIQYYAPWFRRIHASAPEVALTVVHATQPTPKQQGAGFDRAFEWDLPLTEGYRSIVVRPAHEHDRIDSSSFTGLDVPQIGRAIAETTPDVVDHRLVFGDAASCTVRVPSPGVRCCIGAIVLAQRADRAAAALTIKTQLLPPARRLSVAGVRVKIAAWPACRIPHFEVPHAVDNEAFGPPPRNSNSGSAAHGGDGARSMRSSCCLSASWCVSKRPVNVVRAVARLARALMVVGSGRSKESSFSHRLGVSLKM